MVNINMGERLKSLRTKRKWTQKQVANRIGLAISAVSAYELGTRYPSYDILLKLARLYNVSTDYLIGKDEAQSIDVSGLTGDEINVIAQMIDVLRKNITLKKIENPFWQWRLSSFISVSPPYKSA